MTGKQRRRLIRNIDRATRAHLSTIHLADIRDACVGCGSKLDHFNTDCSRCLDRRRKRIARHGVA